MSQPRWDPDERRWLLDREDVPGPGRRRRPDEHSGIDVDGRERDARSGRAPLSVAELTRTELDEDRDPRPRARDRDDRAPRPSPVRAAADPPRPSPHGGGRRRAAYDAPAERSRAAGPGRYDERLPVGPAGAGSWPDAELDERRPGYALDDRGTGGHPSVRHDGYGARRRGADRYGADPLGTDRYGADPLGAERYGADPLGADRYGADPLGTDRNGVDPYDPARFDTNGYGARGHEGLRSRRHDVDERDASGGIRSRNGSRRYDERADDGYGAPQAGPGRHDADGRDAVGYGAPSRNGAAPYADGNGTRGPDGAGGDDPYADRYGVRAREDDPFGQDVVGYGIRGRAGSAHQDIAEDAVGYDPYGDLDDADRRDVDDRDLGYGAYGYDPDGYDDGRHAEPDQVAPGGRAARRRAARALQDDARHETRDLGPAAREDDGYGTGEQVPVAAGAEDGPDDPPARRRRRWPWVVGGVAVLGGLAVPVVLAMQDGTQGERVSSSTVGATGYGANQGAAAQPADDAPAAGEVVFQVTGSGSAGTITIGRGTTISQSSGAQLPWEQKYPGAPAGSEYTLAATGADDADEIGCKISVDGAVIAEQKAEGDYASVSCTGRR